MKRFYENLKNKRKGRKIKLQTNQEFLQNEIKDLILKHEIEMFTTPLRGRKAFVAVQNIRELKKRLQKTKTIEKRFKNIRLKG